MVRARVCMCRYYAIPICRVYEVWVWIEIEIVYAEFMHAMRYWVRNTHVQFPCIECTESRPYDSSCSCILYLVTMCTWMAWRYLSTQHNCIASRGRRVPESIASTAFSPLVYRARKSKYTYSPVTIKMDADWSLRYSLKALTQFMCALCAMRKRNQININTHAIHRCRIVVSSYVCVCG